MPTLDELVKNFNEESLVIIKNNKGMNKIPGGEE